MESLSGAEGSLPLKQSKKRGLKAVRGVKRSIVTKIHSKALAFRTSLEGVENPCDEVERERNLMLDTLRRIAAEIKDFNLEILMLSDDLELEEDADGQEEYDMKIAEAMSILERSAQVMNSSKLAVEDQQDSILQQLAEIKVSCERPQPGEHVSYKLPEFEIIPFSGNRLEYAYFREQFNDVVDSNPRMSNVVKLSYLKRYLRGTPLSKVLTLKKDDPSSYLVALSKLDKCYGSVGSNAQDHINRLMSIRPVHDYHDVIGLRRLSDFIEEHTEALKSLEVPLEKYSLACYPILLSAVPLRLADEFSMHFDNFSISKDTSGDICKTLETEEFIKFLSSSVERRERYLSSRRDTQGGRPRVTKVEREPVKKSYEPPKSSFVFRGDVKPICIFCSKEHKSSQCKTTMCYEDRFNKIKSSRNCFRCIDGLHLSRTCKLQVTCAVCGKNHHTMLHPPGGKLGADAQKVEVKSVSTCGSILKTATAWLKGSDGKNFPVRMLFDDGSQATFIRKHLSEEAALRVLKHEVVSVIPFGKSVPIRVDTRRVSLNLTSMSNSRVSVDLEAFEIDTVGENLYEAPSAGLIDMAERRSLVLSDQTYKLGSVQESQFKELDLVIGADFYDKLVISNRIQLTDSVNCHETIFGWAFFGNLSSDRKVRSNRISVVPGPPLEDLEAHWRLEHLGILDESKEDPSMGERDKVIVDDFRNSITVNSEGRYAVSLPTKPNKLELLKESNYKYTLRRLICLERRLERLGKTDEVDACIRKWVTEGKLEEVPVDEVNLHSTPDHIVWYIPLVAVFAKKGVRVCLDCSASLPQSPALNDILYEGPNSNQDLVEMLMNFRRFKIGLTADLKEAFLRISLNHEFKDCFRILWRIGDTDAIRMFRVIVVPFGAKCSTFLLSATIDFHIDKYKGEIPEQALQFLRSRYVDDFVGGADDLAEATMIVQTCTQVMSEAKMTLCKWKSNIQSTLPQEPPEPMDSQIFKVLGIHWDTVKDCFLFCPTDTMVFLSDHKIITKRLVLQVAARVFDPLGWLSCFVCRVKVLFQQMWLKQLAWDEPLPAEMQKSFVVWVEELETLDGIEIQRRFSRDDKLIINAQLHSFSDASKTSYAVAVYLRLTFSDHSVECTLLMAKSRVAPLKSTTIPRLELLAAVLNARLSKFILERLSLCIDKVFHWVDSAIVLFWLNGDQNRWKQFVSNRVSNILSLTDLSDWRHCPGELNPADLGSRGIAADVLLDSKLWWKGPCFLSLEERNWPESKVDLAISDTRVCEELKPKFAFVSVGSTQVRIDELFPISKFNSYQKILRIVSLCLEFISRCRVQSRNTSEGTSSIGKAEQVLLQLAQKQEFGNDFGAFLKSLPAVSKFRNISLFMDEKDIVRVKTRFLESEVLMFDEKFPIFVPENCRLFELIIIELHERLFHCGASQSLASFRSRFFTFRARQLIRAVLSKCSRCRFFKARKYVQREAPLPQCRTDPVHPFESTGVDFAGPIWIMEAGKPQKAYICLFTCLVSRAVHLELVSSLGAANFLSCLKRFVSRRGLPSIILSDNGTNFVRARRDLQILWKGIRSPEAKEYYDRRRIQWKLNVPAAPWWGGAWERLVGVMKNCLKRVMSRSLLSFEDFATVLCQVEAVLNSRPLNYLASEANGEVEVLTPSKLLLGRDLTSLPPERFLPTAGIASDLVRLHRRREQLVESFWQLFRKAYLLQLRTANESRNVNPIEIQKGTLVLLSESNVPRALWPMATITEVHPGRDGLVRSVTLKTAQGRVLKRPVQTVCPLEVY